MALGAAARWTGAGVSRWEMEIGDGRRETVACPGRAVMRAVRHPCATGGELHACDALCPARRAPYTCCQRAHALHSAARASPCLTRRSSGRPAGSPRQARPALGPAARRSAHAAAGAPTSASQHVAAVHPPLTHSPTPGTTWNSSMPSSISLVSTLSRGCAPHTRRMPSGAAMTVRNRILLSCTPFSSSTCAARAGVGHGTWRRSGGAVPHRATRDARRHGVPGWRAAQRCRCPEWDPSASRSAPQCRPAASRK